MTLDEYLASDDHNLFWRLGSGEHQNLLDEAVERLESRRMLNDDLRNENTELRERVAELEGAPNKPWTVKAVVPREGEPFRKIECEIIDIGYADKILTIRAPDIRVVINRQVTTECEQ